MQLPNVAQSELQSVFERESARMHRSAEVKEPSFAEQVQQFVQGVNATHHAVDQKVTEVAEGRDNDLHGTMIAMEEANIQLRLMTTVRDKVIEAYHEVMRMGG